MKFIRNPTCSSSLLFIAAALAGCATPYKEYGSLGGYSDRELGNGRYFVKFVGNGFTSEQIVREHWNRRASELCKGREYLADAKAGLETQRGIIVNSSGAFPNTERFPMMEGTIQCKI
jgi:hypothetical protein